MKKALDSILGVIAVIGFFIVMVTVSFSEEEPKELLIGSFLPYIFFALLFLSVAIAPKIVISIGLWLKGRHEGEAKISEKGKKIWRAIGIYCAGLMITPIIVNLIRYYFDFSICGLKF